jgi:hypothetical protein
VLSAAVRQVGRNHRLAAVNARPGWWERRWRVLPAGRLLAGGGAVGAMLGWLPNAAVLLVVVAVVVVLLPRRDG